MTAGEAQDGLWLTRLRPEPGLWYQVLDADDIGRRYVAERHWQVVD